MTPAKSSADPWNRGVYLVPDAARILRLPVAVLRSWVCGRMEDDCRHFPVGQFTTDGTGADRHFGFHSLIELFSIAQLRARQIPMVTVRQARAELMQRFQTAHPFALEGLMTSGKTLLKALGDDILLELGTRGQTAFGKVLEPFCAGLDFDQASTLANRYFPLGRQHPVVVDPRRAFGRPVIDGTNLTTEAVMALLRGGEAVDNIADSFRVAPAAILAAKAFEQQKAA
ncbi:MAG: DUF433 domain-containing protein [Verrucomicrobia bacterium]|nr:DUF433 domain-containing protein [Verrucomicrobiota bacterium]